SIKTKSQIGAYYTNFLCKRCYAKCVEHNIDLSLQRITYYGCRICHQSRELIEADAIAILDTNMTQETIHQNGMVMVNWITYRKMFDFCKVRIEQATDEDIERFAVQVGNDADPIQKLRLKGMRCEVSQICSLSENTIRILQHIFGQVVFTDGDATPKS
ncbi:MAG: hypothetical protein KDF65_15900, partial [Anaerolineae bacterium]|nr:hypothetical protein [Anaerolineae bacterium]